MQLVLPTNGVVPANFGELTTYEATSPWSTVEADVRVWEASEPATILFSGNSRSGPVPLGQLTVGKSYVAEVTPSCSWGDPSSKVPAQYSFQVGPASEEPSSLGPLIPVRNGPTMVPSGQVSDGSCWKEVKAVAAEVRVDLAGVPSAWRELLTDYQLMVDGKPFSWQLTIGAPGPKDAPRGEYRGHPGVFQVWTGCGSPAFTPNSVGLGKHTIWVRARVPSSTPKVIESERVEVELACEQAPILPPQQPAPDADAGSAVGATAADASAGGEQDAADEATTTPANGGTARGSDGADEVDESDPDPATRVQAGADDASCSLQPGARSSHGAFVLLGLIAALRSVLKRRR
jgi:hypothetical protein